MNKALIEKYTGAEIPARIADEGMRHGFITNWHHMAANYGEGVDAQLLSEQILLCPETHDELYLPPDPVRYVKGTRPAIERAAKEATKDAKSETECAIAVMRFTRDLHKKHTGWHPFFGGTEEVLIEKGEELCECVARLAVAMLEVLGIPARIITHTIGGHVTAEAYADGKWGYIDPRCGMYALLPDGRLASLWELWQDPSILDRQSDLVKADVSPRFKYTERIAALKQKYLSAKEVNTFKYYSLADAEKYNYTWQTDEGCIALDMNRISKDYAEARRAVMFPDQPKAESYGYHIRLTISDGATLTDDIMLGARMMNVMCHPRIARFYIDGELAYETDGWIPVSELSTFQHGVVYFGGANGSLPVSKLSEGAHTLRVEMVVTPTITVDKEITFFVKH